ncbi:MAG: choice-of-anchor J domain-containing protein [Candidatus Cryptobacteroides sp.]
MKINSSIFTLALTSVLAIAGCTEQLGDNSSAINGGVPFSFSASHSDSKTSIEGLQTVWDADDNVNLFHAEAGSTSYVNDNAFVITSQNLSTNTFTGTLAAAIEEGKAYDWYVFYPYSEYNKTPAGTAKENSAYITVGGISQIQKGNNSLAHLSGKSCPLFGVAKSVAASSKLSLTMKHLTSIVEVKVSNNSGAPVKVNSVAFTASEDIVGTYYVNYSNPEKVEYASTGDSYVSETASLSVNSGEEIANGATATFYIAIKPFTAPAGSDLKVSVNGDEQIYPITGDVTFNPGKIKTVKYSIDLPASDEPYPYSESFATDMGKFSINDVSLPSQLTYVWKWASAEYGMKASAYINPTNYASESWLISPVIDMSKAVKPELSFENVARYGSNSNHTLWAREKDGEWAQLTISNYGSGKDWNFVKNTIDVSAYAGKTLQFAFKYVSTTTGAGTWEIKNIKLDESAGDATWTRVTTVAELLAGGTFIIGYEADAKSGIIVPMANVGDATTSKAGFMYSGKAASSGDKQTIDMSRVTETTKYEVSIVASTSVSGAICIKIGDNYLGNTNTKNNCKLFTSESTTTSFTPTLGANDVFTLKITANKDYHTLQYNTGSPRFAVYGGTQKNVVIYKKN